MPSRDFRIKFDWDSFALLFFGFEISFTMSVAKPSRQDIIHAYRHLYRGILHAVQFSMPSRFTARDQLRDAFRKEDPSTFNQERIDRTVKFLKIAARETGLEHKLVKNLLHTAYWRRKPP